MKYFMTMPCGWSHSEALLELNRLLESEGFGTLSEIDVRATFLDKLNLEFPPYKIIGTCIASLAQQAIELEPGIGTLMPCNWIVQQLEDGRVQISVMNPQSLPEITGNHALQSIADDMSARIGRILDRIEAAA